MIRTAANPRHHALGIFTISISFIAFLIAALGIDRAIALETSGPQMVFSVEKTEHGVRVLGNGALWAEYVADGEFKPYLWPIIGPTGKPVTREWPMGPGEGEKKDHPHQKSLWLTHGDVNGVSFWEEAPGRGKIVHRQFLVLAGGEKAVIVAKNAWVTSDGTVLLDELRKLVFFPLGNHRVIDFGVRLTAMAPEVTFGDTKEGTFGIRVADSIAVDSKKGGKIVNSEGQEDAGAWGKTAKWVDYSGPIGDDIVGIAVLNHPQSFRFPTYWHVRTYGLFAANPFGWHDFLGRSDVSGAHTLKYGESLELHYRIILHKGRAEEAGIAKLFEEYSASPVSLP